MFFSVNKKLAVATALCLAIIVAQSFGVQDHDKDEKAKNLKILPKDIGEEQLHAIMRGYSKSLGVRCTFCHVADDNKPPKFDFASDAKPEKTTARKMMKMVTAINKKYIDKIGNHQFEQITCVTCHMGNAKPIVSVDSLPKKQ